jgi:HAD superfamily hydrolase (TIGR01549 family)
MKTYALPRHPRAFVFDIDGTLYDNPAYAAAQIDAQVERLARERGETLAGTIALLESTRAEYARSHAGAKTSLGNTFAALGVPIATSVRWREELLRPEDYLAPDAALREALAEINRSARVCAVTNNPVSVGRRTLAALGVEELFEFVVGLDSTGVSKPDPAPFRLALSTLGEKAGDVVSVGDRYDVDCAAPLELGMGAIWVSGVQEVFRLPDILREASSA